MKKKIAEIFIVITFSLVFVELAGAQNSATTVEQAIRDSGWEVKREQNGDLLFMIPGSKNDNSDSKPILVPKEERAQELSASENERRAVTENKIEPDETEYSFQSIRLKLKTMGWHVGDNADGSFSFYPPKISKTKTISYCPGNIPNVDITLPVDSWNDAHSIALKWLQESGVSKVSIGKIRKIIKTYLVSIVSEKAPFVLKHQLAIRVNDGSVIVLY